MSTVPSDGGAGKYYSELIREQLEEERRRKTSLESRAVAVLTSSGFLTSLLFGLAGVSDLGGKLLASCLGRVALGGALALLLAAAVCAVIVNRVLNYNEPSVDSLRRLLTEGEGWGKTENTGLFRTTELWLKILGDARDRNNGKASWLSRALWAEVVAIGAIGGAVLVALFGAANR